MEQQAWRGLKKTGYFMAVTARLWVESPRDSRETREQQPKRENTVSLYLGGWLIAKGSSSLKIFSFELSYLQKGSIMVPSSFPSPQLISSNSKCQLHRLQKCSRPDSLTNGLQDQGFNKKKKKTLEKGINEKIVFVVNILWIFDMHHHILYRNILIYYICS